MATLLIWKKETGVGTCVGQDAGSNMLKRREVFSIQFLWVYLVRNVTYNFSHVFSFLGNFFFYHVMC